MLNIPYVSQPDQNSCALACYTMVAKYFSPSVDLEKVAGIADWRPGFVVWPFRFWLWMMEQGITITDHDLIDYQAWVQFGIDGLERSTPKEELAFYKTNSYNLGTISNDVEKVISHPKFVFQRTKPTMDDLKQALNQNGVCEVVLNSAVFRHKDEVSLHRVVVLELGKDYVFFHDPGSRGANFECGRSEFEKAWLETLSAPELCVYEISDNQNIDE